MALLVAFALSGATSMVFLVTYVFTYFLAVALGRLAIYEPPIMSSYSAFDEASIQII